MKRQMPNLRELAPLLRPKRPELNATKRRLDSALTIYDLRDIAKRRTPKAPFDYTDGAAEAELSLARARQAFENVEFQPAVLRDVSRVDTSREVLGGPTGLPFGIAPTGFTRLMQTEGELAGAAAAGAAGIPFSLSTMGTASIEDVRDANPNGRNWFQLYMWKDREKSMDLVRRADAAGYDTLIVTVDVPVAGARLRDKRNGMSIPPAITAGTVLNAIPRPAWWFNFLTTEPLAFANLEHWDGTVAELLDTMFDPTVDYDDLNWIREQWSGKVAVKGVQTLADAKRLTAAGVDAIVLSNHGGRQLDRAPVPFQLLPTVAKEVGMDIEVHLDTGIMSGADIVAAIALGADFTLIGRAYLYGLMAGGRRGVDRAIEILAEQIQRTMRLLGVSTLDELGPQHVTQLGRGC
jgi:L-lactate dehydrogenase (cytochrome)